MADDRPALRDWHRLFGLLLTDYFTGSPFIVEVERDLSGPQQLLDVVIVRRCCGRFAGRWGTDTIRVVVAGEPPRKAHNAPLD